MAYQVLARKWRPQDFASLIGQQAVVTALTNALVEERIAQAYLFSGIRGVGKTTAARVFAKALNCEQGRASGPCNECTPCREITAGSDLDVLEIDAATYSKVEQVRELAESLKYGPARDRYKVVVLDEVHRLSRQAFDALLKIIEEPPPRLVFIFATTEIDAVPATILSRCQEFHFRRVASSEVAAHLRSICTAEGITASDTALALLARAGEGSVRDAVALLDQLATFGRGTVADEEAARFLGGLDLALFQRLLSAITAGSAGDVVTLAREVDEQGWDPRQVYAHFLAYCRDALHLALGETAESATLPGEERAALARLAAATGYENLLRLLSQLLASELAVRRSESGILALELAWLRAAELPKLTAIERLLSGAPADASSTPAPSRAAKPLPGAAPAPAPPPADAPAPTETPRAPEARDEPGTAETFLAEVSARRPALAAQLQALATLTFSAADRRLVIQPHDALAAGSLARANNRDLIDAAVRAAFGEPATWRFAPVAPAAEHPALPPAAASPAAANPESTPAEHPRVQAVLDIFGGTVAAVEPAGSDEEPSR